jgi:hypothetical protein
VVLKSEAVIPRGDRQRGELIKMNVAGPANAMHSRSAIFES